MDISIYLIQQKMRDTHCPILHNWLTSNVPSTRSIKVWRKQAPPLGRKLLSPIYVKTVSPFKRSVTRPCKFPPVAEMPMYTDDQYTKAPRTERRRVEYC